MKMYGKSLLTGFLICMLTIIISAYQMYTLSANGKIHNSREILYVGGAGPNNYTSIQVAINEANPGDVIHIYRGIYHETITVDKELIIEGEDRNTTIIHGGDKGDVLTIEGSNVEISGLTIAHSGENFLNAGVKINANNIEILNCNVQDNNVGILCNYYSHNIKIQDCSIRNNSWQAILLQFASNVSVLNCNVSSGVHDGIHLKYSYNVTVRGCNLVNCGLTLEGNALPQFLHTISDNTVNGKPLLYFKNIGNVYISGIRPGQVILVNCTDFEISDAEVEETEVGIEIAYCEGGKIRNCKISLNDDIGISFLNAKNIEITKCDIIQNFDGIKLSKSTDVKICNCKIHSSKNYGIGIFSSSSIWVDNSSIIMSKDYGIIICHTTESMISNCSICSNKNSGIWLCESTNNTIYRCNISNNDEGILIDKSSKNTIYLNNFNKNNRSVYSPLVIMPKNLWNSSRPQIYTYDGRECEGYLGNYWDDYFGLDQNSDGVGDNPYDIFEGEKDYFPLIKPSENYILGHSKEVSKRTPGYSFSLLVTATIIVMLIIYSIKR